MHRWTASAGSSDDDASSATYGSIGANRAESPISSFVMASLRCLFEGRGDVARGDAAQVAHLGGVERPRPMHGAAVVPDHQVALAPAMSVDELPLGGVLHQLHQQQ